MRCVLRAITSMWPRSGAERFADRLWPDRPTPTKVSVEPLVADDSFHYCASDAMPATDARPAGASVPQPTPPAGHSNPPHVGNTPAAESEARSSAAGSPDLVELIDRWRARAARWETRRSTADPADVAYQLRVAANELFELYTRH